MADIEPRLAVVEALLNKHVSDTAESRREIRDVLSTTNHKIDELTKAVNARENQAKGAAFASKIGVGVLSMASGAAAALGIKFGLK